MEVYPSDDYKSKTIVIKNDAMFDKSHILLSKNHEKYIDKVIVSKGMILDRIEAVASNIVKDYHDKNVNFLCVMKGAITYNSVLSEKITSILKHDVNNSLNMDFSCEYISISSYENDKSTGVVKIKQDEKILENLKNKHIIIVEDIYDSGATMTALINYLRKFEPASIKTTVLFQKMNLKHLKYNYFVDYIGFLIPDEFVIGFGLDYNEEFRQLDHLCSINSLGIEKFKVKP